MNLTMRRLANRFFRWTDRLFLSESMHYRIYHSDELKVR
jgi:hypothetical protein